MWLLLSKNDYFIRARKNWTWRLSNGSRRTDPITPPTFLPYLKTGSLAYWNPQLEVEKGKSYSEQEVVQFIWRYWLVSTKEVFYNFTQFYFLSSLIHVSRTWGNHMDASLSKKLSAQFPDIRFLLSHLSFLLMSLSWRVSDPASITFFLATSLVNYNYLRNHCNCLYLLIFSDI